MNPDLSKLQPYPFEKLTKLKAAVTANAQLPHIALSIGEPQHPSPAFVQQAMIDNISRLENYPTTKGLPELSEAIASWLKGRFSLDNIDPVSQVIPVNGTREAIFAFTQAVVDRSQPDALVVSPNPFYQIYEGAAYLAGATPHFLPCLANNDFHPDYNAVPADVWQRCQLLFLCTPGNPTGAVLSFEQFKQLIELADRYNFVLASDECYSEIYVDGKEAPMGLLEACARLGRHDYKNCVVFHSLSKRSNLAGLRVGFYAGDPELVSYLREVRKHQGFMVPGPAQAAGAAALDDQAHVDLQRERYRRRLGALVEVFAALGIPASVPDGAFYLWVAAPDGDAWTLIRRLAGEIGLVACPGGFFGEQGAGHVRVAAVATDDRIDLLRERAGC